MSSNRDRVLLMVSLIFAVNIVTGGLWIANGYVRRRRATGSE